MAYEWTDDMQPVAGNPTYEDAVRAAISAGARFLDELGDGDPPRFTGARVAIAKNESAAGMAAICEEAMSNIQGSARLLLHRKAIQLALLVHRHGGGDAGWAALKSALAADAPASPAAPESPRNENS